MEAASRILVVSSDPNVLLPEDPGNEGQFRQGRYCDLLNQERSFIVVSRASFKKENRLFGGKIQAVGIGAPRQWLKAFRAYREGIRLAARIRPDAVEYQDPFLTGLIAYRIAKKLNIPLLGGVFNDLIDNPTFIRNSLMRRIVNRTKKFVLSRTTLARCDSLQTTLSLRAKGFTNVRHINFFVPWLEKFSAVADLPGIRMKQWEAEPKILCVARLAEEKNIPLLLRAFATLRERLGKGRLVIVGSGPLEAEVKALSTGLGIDPHVDWAGAKAYLDLVSFFREANLFALSSNSETSARVLVLAQAMHLPTVSTDTSGAPEIVKNGRTGFITPVGDVGAFAEKLILLVESREHYRKMAESMEFDSSEKFGEPLIDGDLKKYYTEARSSKPAAGTIMHRLTSRFRDARDYVGTPSGIMRELAKGVTLPRAFMNAKLRQSQAGGLILDLGGGGSKNSKMMSLLTGSRVLTSDIRPSGKPDFVCNLESSIPLKTGRLDFVLLLNVLEHIHNYRNVISEIGRTIKPGGSLLLFVPYFYPRHTAVYKGFFVDDYFRFGPGALRRLLKSEGGFQGEIRIETCGRGPFTAIMNILLTLRMPGIARRLLIITGILLDYVRVLFAGDPRKQSAVSEYPLAYWVTATR